MLALDLFNTRFEKNLQEGALDDTITRTQAHLMEPLSKRAAEIRTQLRSGKLRPMQIQQLEREYEDLVDKRMKILKGEITSQEECMGYGGLGEDVYDTYTNTYSPEAIALGKRFCEHYNITDDDDIQFAVEIIDNELEGFKHANQPVDLKRIKSSVADAFRQAFRGIRTDGPNFRKHFKEAGLPDIADKQAKMSQLNQPGRAGTDTVKPQQRVNPNPNKGVVGHAADWLRGKGGPGKEGPTYEDLDEQATPGSTAQGVYNEMIQAWTDEKDHLVIPFPNSPNATLTRPQLWNALVTLGQVAPNRRAKYIESKFNDFETFMHWLNQIKRYKVPAKKKKNVQQAMDLQPQVVAPPSVTQAAEPQVPMAETRGQKKNSEDPDLTGSTARDATVQRELQKVRARHPSARTDIEALVKDEIVNQERVNQEIEHLETVDSQQDAQLKQALTLNRQQEQEITNLNQELSRLDSRLNQIMSTTAAKPTTQPTKSATTTKATPATATPLSVTPATTEPIKPAEPVADKSAAEIVRLEKQIQQLELMMTLKTPAQQDDLRDRIDALEKERDAKVEKQKAATAKGAATRKANKDKAAAAAASEKPSSAPTTVEPEKTQKPYYPDTAGIAGMGGSTKTKPNKPNKPTGMDFLDDLLKGHKIEMDPGETAELDPEELRQTAEVDEGTDNPADIGSGKQLRRTPEIRRLKQVRDYELMLKKELANRIQDRNAEDDEQDFQDVTESNMKRMLGDLDDMTDAEFLQLYKRPKQYWRNQLAVKSTPASNINDLESDIDTAVAKPTFDRTGRMVRTKPANTQQGMRRMLGRPKTTRLAPALEPVEVTMQVPNRKTDQYDLLPARIFNSEAEAREFARRVNGYITSIKPVMHEATVGGSGLTGLQDHYAVYKKENGRVTKVKDTNKAGGPMNSLQAQAYVNTMIKNNPQRYNHETVWHAPADIDLDEGQVVPFAIPDDRAQGNYEQMNYRKNPSDRYGVIDHTFNKLIVTANNLKQAKMEAIEWADYDDIKTSVVNQKTGKTVFVVNGSHDAEQYMYEAANPAQQSAIAINMKKHHKKPKHVEEDAIPGKMVTQGFVVEYDPTTQTVVISKRGQELDRFAFKGKPNLIGFQKIIARRVKALEDDLYGADDEAGAVSLSRVKVPGRGYGFQELGEESSTSSDEAESAILKRIMTAHLDLLKEFGPQKVMQAVEEVAYNVGDLDEIGSSDVSAWVHEVKQILGAE